MYLPYRKHSFKNRYMRLIRCNVPGALEIYDTQPKLSAIDRLKNCPRNSISQSQVKDSILSKTRIHISLDNDDDIETGIITYINENGRKKVADT